MLGTGLKINKLSAPALSEPQDRASKARQHPARTLSDHKPASLTTIRADCILFNIMPDAAIALPSEFTINKSNASALAKKRWDAYRAKKQAKTDLVQNLSNHLSAEQKLDSELEPTIARVISDRSGKTKALLSIQAVKQAEAIAEQDNAEPGKFKTVVEACDKLFGWSRTTQPSCLIQNNYLHEIAPDRVPQPVVSCGVSPDTEQNNQKL